jgi:hypothetical protein
LELERAHGEQVARAAAAHNTANEKAANLKRYAPPETHATIDKLRAGEKVSQADMNRLVARDTLRAGTIADLKVAVEKERAGLSSSKATVKIKASKVNPSGKQDSRYKMQVKEDKQVRERFRNSDSTAIRHTVMAMKPGDETDAWHEGHVHAEKVGQTFRDQPSRMVGIAASTLRAGVKSGHFETFQKPGDQAMYYRRTNKPFKAKG